MAHPKTDPNAPAMPVAFDTVTGSGEVRRESVGGLTKREEFVKAAMQGLCADPAWTEVGGDDLAASVAALGRCAVRIADATIAALNEEAGHGE